MARGISKAYMERTRQEMFERRRNTITELLKTSPIYEKPTEDPNIELSYIKGQAAMTDKVTGDYCISHGGDVSAQTFALYCYSKSGLLAIVYGLQYISGYPKYFDFIPLRLFDVSETSYQNREVQATRDRLSKQRIAQFLASLPRFTGPDRPFKIIDAPVPKGTLLG